MSDVSRIAFTGAGGMLGRELARAAAARGVGAVGWDRAACDITDGDSVRRAVESAAPAAVIHAAAWTDVDGCEGDPARAFLVNGRGTANVAAACRESGVRLVAVSTDYVFSGDKEGAYVESDPPGPLSVYGWSKLMGEEAVLALGGSSAVARTAWVYADHGRNFLLTMLRLAGERDRLSVVDDQHGSPTFAADLAEGLLDLAASPAGGVFHLTNRGATTWNGFARAILAATHPAVEIAPVSSDAFPRPARRPTNSVLASTRSDAPELPGWDDGLERCLARGVSA